MDDLQQWWFAVLHTYTLESINAKTNATMQRSAMFNLNDKQVLIKQNKDIETYLRTADKLEEIRLTNIEQDLKKYATTTPQKETIYWYVKQYDFQVDQDTTLCVFYVNRAALDSTYIAWSDLYVSDYTDNFEGNDSFELCLNRINNTTDIGSFKVKTFTVHKVAMLLVSMYFAASRITLFEHISRVHTILSEIDDESLVPYFEAIRDRGTKINTNDTRFKFVVHLQEYVFFKQYIKNSFSQQKHFMLSSCAKESVYPYLMMRKKITKGEFSLCKALNPYGLGLNSLFIGFFLLSDEQNSVIMFTTNDTVATSEYLKTNGILALIMSVQIVKQTDIFKFRIYEVPWKPSVALIKYTSEELGDEKRSEETTTSTVDSFISNSDFDNYAEAGLDVLFREFFNPEKRLLETSGSTPLVERADDLRFQKAKLAMTLMTKTITVPIKVDIHTTDAQKQEFCDILNFFCFLKSVIEYERNGLDTKNNPMKSFALRAILKDLSYYTFPRRGEKSLKLQTFCKMIEDTENVLVIKQKDGNLIDISNKIRFATPPENITSRFKKVFNNGESENVLHISLQRVMKFKGMSKGTATKESEEQWGDVDITEEHKQYVIDAFNKNKHKIIAKITDHSKADVFVLLELHRDKGDTIVFFDAEESKNVITTTENNDFITILYDKYFNIRYVSLLDDISTRQPYLNENAIQKNIDYKFPFKKYEVTDIGDLQGFVIPVSTLYVYFEDDALCPLLEDFLIACENEGHSLERTLKKTNAHLSIIKTGEDAILVSQDASNLLMVNREEVKQKVIKTKDGKQEIIDGVYEFDVKFIQSFKRFITNARKKCISKVYLLPDIVKDGVPENFPYSLLTLHLDNGIQIDERSRIQLIKEYSIHMNDAVSLLSGYKINVEEPSEPRPNITVVKKVKKRVTPVLVKDTKANGTKGNFNDNAEFDAMDDETLAAPAQQVQDDDTDASKKATELEIDDRVIDNESYIYVTHEEDIEQEMPAGTETIPFSNIVTRRIANTIFLPHYFILDGVYTNRYTPVCNYAFTMKNIKRTTIKCKFLVPYKNKDGKRAVKINYAYDRWPAYDFYLPPNKVWQEENKCAIDLPQQDYLIYSPHNKSNIKERGMFIVYSKQDQATECHNLNAVLNDRCKIATIDYDSIDYQKLEPIARYVLSFIRDIMRRDLLITDLSLPDYLFPFPAKLPKLEFSEKPYSGVDTFVESKVYNSSTQKIEALTEIPVNPPSGTVIHTLKQEPEITDNGAVASPAVPLETKKKKTIRDNGILKGTKKSPRRYLVCYPAGKPKVESKEQEERKKQEDDLEKKIQISYQVFGRRQNAAKDAAKLKETIGTSGLFKRTSTAHQRGHHSSRLIDVTQRLHERLRAVGTDVEREARVIASDIEVAASTASKDVKREFRNFRHFLNERMREHIESSNDEEREK